MSKEEITDAMLALGINEAAVMMEEGICDRPGKFCQSELNAGTVFDQISRYAADFSGGFICGQIIGAQQFLFVFNNYVDIIQMNKAVPRHPGIYLLRLSDPESGHQLPPGLQLLRASGLYQSAEPACVRKL